MRPRPGDLVPRATSRAMLRAAAVAGHRDAAEITRLLYGAGSVPLTPRLARAYPPRVISHVVRAAVEADPGARASYRLVAHPYWLSFFHVDHDGAGDIEGAEGTTDPRRETLRHKVYLSVDGPDLFAVLPAVAALAARHEVGGFKVGGTTQGVLRSDKAVLYCADPGAAHALAEELDDLIARRGVRAHGVPFTGQVGLTGAVSRGIDPPALDGEPRSWRSWICARTAEALVTASTDRPRSAPARVAVARHLLTARGIDALTWCPDLTRSAELTGSADRTGVAAGPGRAA